MGKGRKSNSANAAATLESNVSPILEINYADPLFAVASHPSEPILANGFVSGHVYCFKYDVEKLEEQQSRNREEFQELQRRKVKIGEISLVVKSVSQSHHRWWSVISDHSSVADPLVTTLWKTKRHKGSCRSLLFDPLEGSLGSHIYTVGTDNVIKKALTESGKVLSKTNVVKDFHGKDDSITQLCHSSTKPFLLAGTENGDVLVYDSSDLKEKIKYRVSKAHDDAINHILPMPDVSAYHYMTLGSTTLLHIDIRKGIITQSDDQEDELLSMCYTNDNINGNKNDSLLVAHGEGLVTIWKNSKNKFMDQLSRIKVNKNASIDSIIPTMNLDDQEVADSVWCGDSDGLLHRINYKRGKVVETRVHSLALKKNTVDEVGLLEIDCGYRLISAGMDSLKIWSAEGSDEIEIPSDESDDDSSGEEVDSTDGDSDGLSDSDLSDSDDLNDSDEAADNQEELDTDDEVKKSTDSESNGDKNVNDNSDHNDVSPIEAESKSAVSIIRKKRRFTAKEGPKIINLNSTKSDEKEEMEEPSEMKKTKVKKMSTKQIRNLQKHEHGIRKFDGL